MNLVEKLRLRMAEIVAEMRKAQDDDNETRFTELETEFAELETKLQTAEERAARLAQAEERAAAAASAAEQEARKGEERSRKAGRILSGGKPSAIEVSTEDRAKFTSLGEQVLEAHFLHMNKRARTGGVYEARAANGYAETPDEKGGIVLQEDLMFDFTVKQVTEPCIIERCRQFRILGNAMKIPRLINYDQTANHTGASTVTWMGETGTLTPASGKFEMRRYELKKAGAVVPISNDMLEDAAAMESMIMANVPKDLRNAIQDAILNGNDPARPGGLLYAAATVEQDAEENQDAQTVVFENVVKMWSRLLPSSKPNSVWIVHPDVIPQLQLMNVAVGTGGLPVFLPPTGAAGAPFGTLMGRPIIEDQNCQALGTKGDMYLVDLSEYNLVMKASATVKMALSTHLYFLTDQTAMRFVQRIDGAPYPSAPFTLANGSATRSSFVVLADRA